MATQNEDNTRRIVGGVNQGGRLYKAGDEEALAGVLTQKNIDRLVEKGVLAGNWSSTEPASTAPADAASANEEKSAPAERSSSKRGR